MKRQAEIQRNTRETKIKLKLNLDGHGQAKIQTGIGFLDHMLTVFALHGSFDLAIVAQGDLNVDQHHLLEDLGITLGEALAKALGNRTGIFRAGFWHGAFLFPMDETAAIVAVDLAKRCHLTQTLNFPKEKVGELQTENIVDFFEGFVNGAKCNLFLKTFQARSTHHLTEAIFKAFGRALRMAVQLDQQNKNQVKSTKGCL